MEIGARLKEAREQKNLSLEDLQETTKIQKRYLAAIEEGNFGVLPGKFYAKAFIKEYANAVGLDPNELLDDFEEKPPVQTEELETAEYTRIKQNRDRSQSRSNPSLVPKLTVVLLIAAIIVLAIVFYQKTAANDSTDPVKNQDGNEIIRTPEPDEDTSTTAPAAGQDKEKPAKKKKADSAEADKKAADKTEKEDKDGDVRFSVVSEGTGSAPESEIEAKNVGEKVKVTIESSGDSWLEVKDGNGTSKYSGSLTESKSPLKLDFDGEKEVYFVIGKAPDLTIKVNGQKLDYPVDPAQKVFQKIRLKLQPEQ